jgi:hypothetical protein
VVEVEHRMRCTALPTVCLPQDFRHMPDINRPE